MSASSWTISRFATGVETIAGPAAATAGSSTCSHEPAVDPIGLDRRRAVELHPPLPDELRQRGCARSRTAGPAPRRAARLRGPRAPPTTRAGRRGARTSRYSRRGLVRVGRRHGRRASACRCERATEPSSWRPVKASSTASDAADADRRVGKVEDRKMRELNPVDDVAAQHTGRAKQPVDQVAGRAARAAARARRPTAG